MKWESYLCFQFQQGGRDIGGLQKMSNQLVLLFSAVCFFMLFLHVSEFIRIFAHGLRPDSVVPEIYNQLKGN